jgi:hypothetical protein
VCCPDRVTAMTFPILYHRKWLLAERGSFRSLPAGYGRDGHDGLYGQGGRQRLLRSFVFGAGGATGRAARPGDGCAWGFVCGVMFRCGLQAHSTFGAWVCLGFRLRGHVPLRAASPQHVRRMGVRGDSCAGSCSAAGCKPTARPAHWCAWGFVCGVMFRCGLQAHSTSGRRVFVHPVHPVHK